MGTNLWSINVVHTAPPYKQVVIKSELCMMPS
uniref:Uncharacterized protein n=1 Tax=Anguilla anguilla TaxID=7936 RepID=A0A0E9P8W9_ANGAN